MGSSSISFGDDGGESKHDARKQVPPAIRREYPAGHSLGATSLRQAEKGIVAQNSAKFDKQRERSYPGGHNMGMAQVTTTLVPPPYPHPRVSERGPGGSGLPPVLKARATQVPPYTHPDRSGLQGAAWGRGGAAPGAAGSLQQCRTLPPLPPPHSAPLLQPLFPPPQALIVSAMPQPPSPCLSLGGDAHG